MNLSNYISKLFLKQDNNTIFLDTETTGLDPTKDKIVEISIIDNKGRILLNTLVNPKIKIPEQATNIHGISNDEVKSYPTFEEIYSKILKIVNNKHLVIYNATYDLNFFPNKLSNTKKISCCMLRYSEYKKIWNNKFKNYKWFKLEEASRWANHKWTGEKHRALSDTFACRTVWNALEKVSKNF